MRYKRFKTENLCNEEWFQFYAEFKDVVEQHTPQTLEIEPLFTTFQTLYANVDEALEVIRKSTTTDRKNMTIQVERFKNMLKQRKGRARKDEKLAGDTQ